MSITRIRMRVRVSLGGRKVAANERNNRFRSSLHQHRPLPLSPAQNNKLLNSLSCAFRFLLTPSPPLAISTRPSLHLLHAPRRVRAFPPCVPPQSAPTTTTTTTTLRLGPLCWHRVTAHYTFSPSITVHTISSLHFCPCRHLLPPSHTYTRRT